MKIFRNFILIVLISWEKSDPNALSRLESSKRKSTETFIKGVKGSKLKKLEKDYNFTSDAYRHVVRIQELGGIEIHTAPKMESVNLFGLRFSKRDGTWDGLTSEVDRINLQTMLDNIISIFQAKDEE